MNARESASRQPYTSANLDQAASKAADGDFMSTWGVSSQSTTVKRQTTAPAPAMPAKVARTSDAATPGASAAAAGAAYERSKLSGKVEVTLNGGLEKAEASDPDKPKEQVEVKVLSNYGRREPARYMQTKFDDIASAQEKRFQEIQGALVAANGLEEPSQIGRPNQDKSNIVGRICCESEGKLNALSLVLEGGLEAANGTRVKLDAQYLPEYSFFPGQIVAVEGVNTQGHTLIASKSYRSALPNPCPDVERGMLTAAPSVWVASGPFTASGDLEFEALENLLELCQQSPPDLLILVGPFVAPNHAVVKSPTLDMTYKQVFQKMFETIEQMTEEDFSTQIALVPSVHDLHHDCVFPQARYSDKKLPFIDLAASHPYHKKIQCLPNPSIISVGGMMVGISSNDIIKDLITDEASMQAKGTSIPKMVRMANHVMDQRSFYPLFPAPPGAQVDYQREQDFALPVRPDLLVLPSDLTRFAETLSGNTACVNPGRLVKGGNSGTFAKIIGKQLHESVSEELGVAYTAQVDIVKL